MKKLFLILVAHLMLQSNYAQPIEKIEDVINAYQYYRFIPSKYEDVVPLFAPHSVTGTYNSLKICTYSTETYYGKKVKANEYPTETFYAYYNKKGNLVKLIQDNKEYLFKYNYVECSSGHYILVLEGYECYDSSTGSLVEKKESSAPIKGIDWSLWGKKVLEHPQKWFISGLKGEYRVHKSGDGLIKVKHTDGYSLWFDAAFLPQDRTSERMIMLKGQWISQTSEWLKKKEHASCYWKSQPIFCQWAIKDYTNLYYSGDGLSFNPLGLRCGEGISPSEALSQGVRDNILYEYHWTK
ncbi:MAG: hypothetical protein J6Y39_06515 [Bacteroidaceae bacterium]|nr:hypothetical protein [Bacteroidaceae bacterium]